jgi:hypothetical protein
MRSRKKKSVVGYDLICHPHRVQRMVRAALMSQPPHSANDSPACKRHFRFSLTKLDSSDRNWIDAISATLINASRGKRLLTLFALDRPVPRGYTLPSCQHCKQSDSPERAQMSSPLRLTRDDEERLSSPAFQSSASSRVVSFTRPADDRLALLRARFPSRAAFIDRMIEFMLKAS